MILPSFVKRAFANCMRQRFITISDGYSSNAIRRITIRPLFLLVILCIISIFIGTMGYIFAKNDTISKSTFFVQTWLDHNVGAYNPFPAPSNQRKNTTIEHILARCLGNQGTLKESMQDLTHRLQEAETAYQLSKGKIEILQQESEKERAKISDLTARIQMFEELFQSKNKKGTKVLRTVFKLNKPQQINYEVTLAKGGNYPRISRGRLLFIGITAQGKKIPLKLIDGNKYQDYKIETHAFLSGTLHWKQKDSLKKVQVIHQRKTKKNYVQIGKTETDITGENHGIR